MDSEQILLVDHPEALGDNIAPMLREAGYAPTQAGSSGEALEMLGSGKYHLLLTELAMPEVDGLKLLEESKKLDPDMPAIVLSTVHDASVVLAAIRAGAYDYLLKPFEKGQLVDMVRRALETRRLRVENKAYQENLEGLVGARTQQLQRALTDNERSADFALEAIGHMLELKGAEPPRHAQRVTAYAIALARAMGLSQEDIRHIARGAFLHDAGLVAIPDAILQKPGALSPEETEIFREHCIRGYQLLKKIPYLAKAAEIVYAHEEHIDGSGYPRRLKGDQVPLGARIVAVAHFLDASLSGCDGPRLEMDEIRGRLLSESGKRFDLEVVQVFLEMPDKIWADLRETIDRIKQLPQSPPGT